MERDTHKDFFISYTSADRPWAEWIAWQLEQEGYTTLIQAWDFGPGSHFVQEMDTASLAARRTIAVLSPDYFASRFTPSEWQEAFRQDPTGEQHLLLPVRVRSCDVEGLLGQIVYIDLVGQEEQAARTRLLAGVQQQRAKPALPPAFPLLSPLLPERPPFPGSLPSLWNVPYPRNPFFTGREQLLEQLSTALGSGSATTLSHPQAISGLGGIGKTQIAVEYAYRAHPDYHAVFWVRADTRTNLVSDFVTLASMLTLPEMNAQDQLLTVAAVKEWLRTHGNWLLILDNADDLSLVHEFLPPASGGHVLLTTRAPVLGRLAQRIEVDKLEEQVGARFLLHRAGVLASDAPWEKASPRDREAALSITREMDGLPLALDQAAAYIEETPCRVEDYLRLYQQQRGALLSRRGGQVADHPASVATWSLAFAQVEQSNPGAADLLRVCAFLHPDAIPEALLIEGASQLGPGLSSLASDELAFNEAMSALHAYSLLRRDLSDKTLSLHRLVQAVLKDAMDHKTQRRWAECVVRAVNAAFPAVEFATWPRCQQYLPHALACDALIAQYHLAFPQAASLLNRAAWYLREHAQNLQAEPLLQRALAICEKALPPDHPNTANILNGLALLYRNQGRYAEAEPLYQRAMVIDEKALPLKLPNTAITLGNLALLYDYQGRYAEAEPLYQRVLAIQEKALPPDHPHTATTLENYASLLREMNRPAEAHTLEQRANTIRAKQSSKKTT